MEIRLQRSILRPWREADVEALARHANDREVWRNMKDLFPHPYGLAEARAWIQHALSTEPLQLFAIDVAGEAVGGIGVTPRKDVYRRGADLGYWLARSCWNRGIMSEAVWAASEYAFSTLDLMRVQAAVYAWNPPSMRVLEKCGFAREGVLRRAAFKDGQFVDCVLFAKLRPDL